MSLVCFTEQFQFFYFVLKRATWFVNAETGAFFPCVSPVDTMMLTGDTAYVGCHYSHKVLAGTKLAYCSLTWRLAGQDVQLFVLSDVWLGETLFYSLWYCIDCVAACFPNHCFSFN